jgi:RHH-type rel operon transcriptional repressor/antitoxin RelB
VAVALSLRLDSKTAADLEDVAAATDRTKTYIIHKALRQYLDEYVDYQIALDRLKDKDDEILSSSEFKKRLE